MSASDHADAARSHVLLRLNESAARAEIAELIATDDTLRGLTADAVADGDIHAACRAVVERVDLSEGGVQPCSAPRSQPSARRSGAGCFHLINPSLPSPDVSGCRAGLFWSTTMSFPEYARANFNANLRAAACGDLALRECADAVTGEPRYVLCAIARDGPEYTITPFGHLAPGNPYEAYKPPGTSLHSGEPLPTGE